MILQRVRAVGLAAVCGLLCAACGLTGGSTVTTDDASSQPTEPTVADDQTETTAAAAPTSAVADDSPALPETVADIADAALAATKAQDWTTLGELVGPAGLTISLDAYVDDDDLTVSAEEVLGAAEDTQIRRWGASEEPGVFFESTLADQLAALVAISAITDTEDTSMNERLGVGNVIDNLSEAFPTGEYKEFWNGGVNPAFGGLDWTSLRFVVVDGRLRALVQDQWAP